MLVYEYMPGGTLRDHLSGMYQFNCSLCLEELLKFSVSGSLFASMDVTGNDVFHGLQHLQEHL